MNPSLGPEGVDLDAGLRIPEGLLVVSHVVEGPGPVVVGNLPPLVRGIGMGAQVLGELDRCLLKPSRLEQLDASGAKIFIIM